MRARRKSTVVQAKTHELYERVSAFLEAFGGTWSMASAGFVKSDTVVVANKRWIVSFRIDAYHVDRDLTTKPRLRASVTIWPPRQAKVRRSDVEREWIQSCERKIRRCGYEGEWRRSPWGRFGDFWKDLESAKAVAAEVTRLDKLEGTLRPVGE